MCLPIGSTMSATSRAAAQLLHVLPRERITRLVGRATRANLPPRLLRPVLDLYGRAYSVDLSEAVVPDAGFASFNDFFTRRLREGIRPVDPDPASVVSPADGRLDDLGPITEGSTFTVKGQRYDAAALLGDDAEARGFVGGEFFIVYLSPRDYHRVHAPVAGRVARVRHIPGTLYPVNDFGVREVPGLLARNERVVVYLDSDIGRVAVVLVGAFVVGRIDLYFPAPPRPAHGGAVALRDYPPEGAPSLARGAELGAFLLGSTVVVLLPPAARGRWAAASDTRPGPVRMGEAVTRRVAT